MSEYIYERSSGRQHRKEEIVRCRDCRHYEYWEFRDGSIARDCARGGDYLFDTEPNGFCSWGERRDADKRSISKERAIEGVLMCLIDSSNTVEFDAMTAIEKATTDIMEIMGGES